MNPISKAMNAKAGPWQQAGTAADNDDFGAAAREWRGRMLAPAERIATIAPADPPAKQLSIRAENVLKELAVDLTGVVPPKGRWTPSNDLLRKLTYGRLLAARNCGPQTSREIIEWAQSRGVAIRPPFHAGKPLSATWQELVAKFSAGEFSKAEIAEALERSARRKNTRIPVAFQNVLSKILGAAGE